ncbi:hypothetical protein EJB05_25185, partial [Eragrostis curvula]
MKSSLLSTKAVSCAKLVLLNGSPEAEEKEDANGAAAAGEAGARQPMRPRHLLPAPETGPSPPRELTREDERRLLVALSRVNKAIRGWDEEEEVEEEQGCESDDQETGSCSGKIHSCCLPRVHHSDDGLDCLRNMVSVLVGFLGFSSDYVKHSARNILVSMSISLTKLFIEFIWAAIHASPTYVHQALPSKMGLKSHDIASTSTSITSFMAVVKLRSCVISGQMMASLFQVLHAMLKFLKHNDSELKGDFICLSIHHIQKMPWESVHQLGARELVSDAMDSKFSFCHNLAESGILTGSLLQLLCSLLEQTSLQGTDGQDMYVKLVDIVPKLAAFLQEQHDGPRSLYQYSKHKVLVNSDILSSSASLMVMMRLKPYMQDCSHIVCWLKLLRQYFEDLLHEPISQHTVKPSNCLEGSPFWLNMVGLVEIEDKSTRHLQRRAIYLFLSCCICLSCNRKGTLQCSCKTDNYLVGHKVQGCIDHCNCFGLSEILDWFQRCYLDKSFDSEPSTDCALSFLQLYIEEDDMLFRILLQLLDSPLISMRTDVMEATQLIGAKLFSSIFDPVHLFHLLLLLLDYDHLVLVDYLISKDVGVDCAQYLLRQKTSQDANGAKCSSSKERMNAQKLFISAKACLLSLKRTVEDLQKKGLFPYNPRPLLRSLARFEELCEQG